MQPALYEAFGLTVIEAMSCGLPTFATICGGPAEVTPSLSWHSLLFHLLALAIDSDLPSHSILDWAHDLIVQAGTSRECCS